MKQNYQLLLDQTIKKIQEQGVHPKLLLHACCAPCSSYVLEYLAEIFDITIFFYNPNIFPEDEYLKRYDELHRLVSEMGLSNRVRFAESNYSPERFFDIAKGLENLPEGGERCKRCYSLRLEEAALEAKRGGFDYFTTTLSISPYKNAQWLCEIGDTMSKKYGVSYLYSDFKKRNGYKRSCELSEEYGLYRQDFCGCVYSKLDRDKRKSEKNTCSNNFT